MVADIGVSYTPYINSYHVNQCHTKRSRASRTVWFSVVRSLYLLVTRCMPDHLALPPPGALPVLNAARNVQWAPHHKLVFPHCLTFSRLLHADNVTKYQHPIRIPC